MDIGCEKKLEKSRRVVHWREPTVVYTFSLKCSCTPKYANEGQKTNKNVTYAPATVEANKKPFLTSPRKTISP